MTPTIGIVDYGMGNRRSVEKAFERVGAHALLTSDHDALRGADGLVVPGVGAFPRAMANLRDAGLDELVRERAADGTPVLGICLGLQLLFEHSEEHEGAAGLGLLRGTVHPLVAPGLKLPHIGWNLIGFRRPLFDLPERAAFYHVHSLAARPADPDDVVAVGEYGTAFVSAVARGNVYGVQFHPEKSSAMGLRLLEGFATVCARQPA